MNIKNYQTGRDIGFSSSIDEEKYDEYVDSDTTATGAVRAGDWISREELEILGIDEDLTIFAE
jgi:hypothetical protein